MPLKAPRPAYFRILVLNSFRWTREGFIPLYGAHMLLPKSMPISGSEAATLGAIRTNAAPCSRIFRQNTGRLLTMLDVEKLPKPPAFLVASKIICDLQLPSEPI